VSLRFSPRSQTEASAGLEASAGQQALVDLEASAGQQVSALRQLQAWPQVLWRWEAWLLPEP
jgi:hypothetical protein